MARRCRGQAGQLLAVPDLLNLSKPTAVTAPKRVLRKPGAPAAHPAHNAWANGAPVPRPVPLLEEVAQSSPPAGFKPRVRRPAAAGACHSRHTRTQAGCRRWQADMPVRCAGVDAGSQQIPMLLRQAGRNCRRRLSCSPPQALGPPPHPAVQLHLLFHPVRCAGSSTQAAPGQLALQAAPGHAQAQGPACQGQQGLCGRPGARPAPSSSWEAHRASAGARLSCAR